MLPSLSILFQQQFPHSSARILSKVAGWQKHAQSPELLVNRINSGRRLLDRSQYFVFPIVLSQLVGRRNPTKNMNPSTLTRIQVLCTAKVKKKLQVRQKRLFRGKPHLIIALSTDCAPQPDRKPLLKKPKTRRKEEYQVEKKKLVLFKQWCICKKLKTIPTIHSIILLVVSRFFRLTNENSTEDYHWKVIKAGLSTIGNSI